MKTTKHFILFTATLMLVLLSGYSDSSVMATEGAAIATESPVSSQSREFPDSVTHPLLLTDMTLNCEQAQTQREMNLCAVKAAKQADVRLNTVYQQLRQEIQDTAQEQRLIDAQLAWIEFRDRDCDYAQSQYLDGSMMPMIYGFCVADLTEKRTRELEDYLEEASL
ncbi:lysozyme inhibitor LprI family protein [Spirulina sp. CS-785/01]|uniref:lysozyme inhibitor LprI family protein n=1 Tax=Spirulina sp. CS-785/01 TaxID=3021716 RepID=UPI002331183D|nr:lysozyme inhibitor LprI family protein [Spirulina sp. CS-785/01]MDB9311549.1 lysozyme inhibitor LprI family protein [Spirulina sp. CS-785/01]